MELNISNKLPDAPDFLNNRAKQIFNSVCEDLKNNGRLSLIDVELIAAYSVEMETYEDACRKLGNNKIYKSPSGYPMVSPLYTLKNQSLKQAQKLAELFGITPSSRVRLNYDQQNKNVSKLDILKNGKKNIIQKTAN
jgi:P27 family predicted phage terminase small subunit